MPTPVRQFYAAHIRATPVGALIRAIRRTLIGLRGIVLNATYYPAASAITECSSILKRASYVRRYYWRRLRPVFGWLIHSRERENFTYDLSARNHLHLAETLAIACGQPAERMLGYIEEVQRDEALKSAIVAAARRLPRRLHVDPTARFGRRVGWYAAVRALRPRVVVETGVDKGIGAMVLCAALLRNAQEGDPGRYLGTDINPAAGGLLVNPYAGAGKILYGDSIASLTAFDGTIDIFINDSDHSADYERREYEIVQPKLSPGALIIGDNAHVTDALATFSRKHGRDFLFLREEPLDHWYLGAGIGLSFCRPRRPVKP